MMAIIGPIAVAAVLGVMFLVWIKVQQKLEDPSQNQSPDGVQAELYDAADMKKLKRYELMIPFFKMCSLVCALFLAIAIASLVIRGADFYTVITLIGAVVLTVGALYGYIRNKRADKAIRKK